MSKLKIGLLNVDNNSVRGLSPTTVLNTYESSSTNFHSEGLFSVETYGPVGSADRLTQFSYIKLNTSVIHPVIYHWLVKSKTLFKDIISGRKYVVFNEDTKMFEESDVDDAKTGYEFFMSKIAGLELEDTGSIQRQTVIRLLKKYNDRLTLNNLLVLPAGLRDYTVSDSGKPSEDVINDYYRRIIGLSGNITKKESESVVFNKARTNMQNSVEDIYSYINTLLHGKKKLLNAKFSKRKVFHATGNVLTSVPNLFLDAKDPRRLKENEIFTGLYQYTKGILPIFVPRLKATVLSRIFPGSFSDMYLCDKKTYEQVHMPVDSALHDMFMTLDGVDKLINAFASHSMRNKPLAYKSYYLALVYQKDDTILITNNVNELPEDYGKHTHPLTLGELLYVAAQELTQSTPVVVTRYPVTAEGGVYVGFPKLRTTNKSQVLHVIDSKGKKTGEVYNDYPIQDGKYYDSMAVHQSHLGPLIGDHDGDLVSAIFAITDDARQEVSDLLDKASYYKDIKSGKLLYSASDDVSDLVLSHLTRF